MVLDFTKMNGAGNDFVLIDNRAQKVKLSRDQVVRLCDRHRGVGADGVLLLVPSASGKADWAWEFYNSDGSTGEMCGNGARCFARFVQKLTGVQRGLHVRDRSGRHHGQLPGRAGHRQPDPAGGVAAQPAGAALGRDGDDSLDQYRRAARGAVRARRRPGDGAAARPRNPPPPALRPEGHQREFRAAAWAEPHPGADVRARRGRRDAGLRHRA